MPESTVSLPREKLEEQVRAIGWFHSIDLGRGLVTPGVKSLAQLELELKTYQLPKLRGRSVLDVGAWDGYFSFAAERLGARRVVALDHYVWSLDLQEHQRYWDDCQGRGILPRPAHETPSWRPQELPGKRGFDLAHAALGSSVEDRVADLMEVNPAELGSFDVVFYLGVLYHMENPFAALKQLARVTSGVAIIETEAVAFPGYESRCVCEFFPSNELGGDVSNWWALNERALCGMCEAAGFRRVDMISKSPAVEGVGTSNQAVRYRAVAHAWK
jgi:tRNA (mo5U34)-methyltransferase